MVADVGRSTGERASRGDVETPRYQVVSLQPNATQARNLGVLIALATLLFGFLGALAFGVAGGVAVAVAGALGHAVARFVHLRRLCPIAPGCHDTPVQDSSPR